MRWKSRSSFAREPSPSSVSKAVSGAAAGREPATEPAFQFSSRLVHIWQDAPAYTDVNDNLIGLFSQKPDLFPFARPLDLERFMIDNLGDATFLPVPSKLFLVDEAVPRGFGYPLAKSAPVDELENRLQKWLDEEILARTDTTTPKKRADDALKSYRAHAVKFAQNALQSSILADYHTVFWLLHSSQVARLFAAFPRHALSRAPQLSREQCDVLKYVLFIRWAQMIRAIIPDVVGQGALAPGLDDFRLRFLRLIADNPFLASEEFISSDFGELRTYFAGSARREFATFKKWLDESRALIGRMFEKEVLFRRAILQLGYPDVSSPLALLDRRVRDLVTEQLPKPWPDAQFIDTLCARLLEYFIVHHLRRSILWVEPNAEGENIALANGTTTVYSRAVRPLDFGRRGIVEPIVYRFGLVYDITAFTQTLGEMARGGKNEEQASYLQMLEFQRELAEVATRHQLQFEKFLGDGAFYTSRRATRTINAAIEFQHFYSTMRTKGFAFNKGMRVAINYGYYRLLPMQVSLDGTEIKEFYGPGIVELSRLTTGKATKIIEDVQHLLLATGYDQADVYKFFAPLSRTVDTTEETMQQREFYAYVNANGNLINEGIVASIPFLKELSDEITQDGLMLYRLTTRWAGYLGFAAPVSLGGYIGLRMLGSVSLKGIGNVEVGEVVRVRQEEADVSIIEDDRPLVQLLQQERNLSTARRASGTDEETSLIADLVVCESVGDILVGEWDPIAEQVRRPIRLAGEDAERFGLAVPLTAESVESQSVAYQKLYRKLSRIETLPSFSISAIRENVNFSGFIIGSSVEPL